MDARLVRPHAATLGFGASLLVFAAAVVAATSYHLSHLREVELQRLRDAAATHVRVFENHLTQSLTVIDLTLRNLVEGASGRHAVEERSGGLGLALRRAPYLRSLSLLDASGRIVASSDPANVGAEPALGRLQPDAAAGAALLRFGSPWEGRDFGNARPAGPSAPAGRTEPGFVPVVRAIDPGSRIVAALNPEYFIGQFVNALPPSDGAVEVLSLDDIVWFSSDERSRAPVPGSRFLAAGLPKPGPGAPVEGVVESPQADGTVEMLAYRVSRLYPLRVQVRLDREQALSAWRRQARALLAAVVPAFLLSVAIAVFVFRHVRRITRDRLDAELRAHDRLAGRVFDSAAEAIMVTDSRNRIVRVNSAFTRLTGYGEDEVRGRNPSLSSSGHQSRDFYASMWREIHTRGQWKGELVNRRKDGSHYPVTLTVSAVRDERGRVVNYVGLFADISERVAREEHIRFLSEHDVLTGLPNRALFQDRVRQAIAQCRRAQRCAAVLFIDLDRFKAVNDTFGHHVGDRLLQETGRRLRTALRESDTVGRQGGDEFLVLLPDLAGRQDAGHVVDKLMSVLCEPYRLDTCEVQVTPSIGVAVFPDDGDDLEALVQAADTAMYHSKSSGRAASHFFSAEMNTAANERLTLEAALRRALERGDLRLHYQPLVDLAEGRVRGVEALLRWTDPVRGEIPPARFVPVAEDCGLIVPIGDWVLREACRQVREWRDQGFGPLTVAVNVSARQLDQSGFVDSVFEVLAQHGLEGSALEIEVTESVLVADGGGRVEQLHMLREAGIRLSIDDFGTGYSSLSYLRRLPIDRIKVDRSFITEVAQDADDALIVGALIDMAHGIGLRVLGEGVETEDQRQFLSRRGCDEVQGYLYSRPLDPAALSGWLRDRQAEEAAARARGLVPA